ncbi:hypothetical protein M7I_1031 [Glarea lozoyensis 74030]|uniref:Velvet domain-containing protein n=1 Tax=Glarea lozoyensis (strain ATCC 74030 / MF5533) TaxID=1104152 RepID=H0EEZ4_GLAL7|nr:hypothetical protein M7I_1031 [Glarea lozoyensis 74030]
MATPAQVQPAGQSITRTTRGIPGDPRNPSRKLTYFINVIQQPERARACGSGAKSSADRRPVDPPPVVQLRIMEGENAENDITFAYDANFFLFATLESVRQIAHGRVHPAPSQIPVLTGMPVSGMAYLDRPHEAGYFIFPDLSVRHEGYYNLSFNLYEQTKEAKDMDAEPSKSPGPAMPENELPAHSFHWRLTVKSQPFTVFSAKKFPGLAESTTLSRTVAEQGCRVRIRRDVRMRRRDKAEEEFNGSQAHDMYARPNRHIEQPQEPYSRERSNSLTGDDARRMSSGYHEQLDAYRSPSGSPSPPLQELAGQEKMSWLKPNNASGPQFSIFTPRSPASQGAFDEPIFRRIEISIGTLTTVILRKRHFEMVLVRITMRRKKKKKTTRNNDHNLPTDVQQGLWQLDSSQK